MITNDRMPIPPRDGIGAEFEIERVPHGWDITTRMRELEPTAENENGALAQAACMIILHLKKSRPEVVPMLHELLDAK